MIKNIFWVDKKKFLKKKDNVFYLMDNPKVLSLKNIKNFKAKLNNTLKNYKLFRICLHNKDKDKYNEMIMFHLKPHLVGPLKQEKNNISFHMIQGKLEITIFNKKKIKKISLSKNSKNPSHIRLKANQYRTIKSLKKNTIFLEISEGPFKDSDTIWKLTKK